MSALARYFNAEGYRVGGYDRTPSPLTDDLVKEGIEIHYEDDINSVPSYYKDPSTTLIVYTPAIPQEHGELSYFRQHEFRILKRAQLLGIVTQSKLGLCIAGTHGKTTTSSMVAHLLKQSHVDTNAFLGGILKPYNSNLMLSKSSDYVVIEADEFDRSFHTLTPHVAAITSCDPDHLDIYGTEEAYRESFAHFTSLIPSGGMLLMRQGIAVAPRLQKGVQCFSYGVVNTATEECELPEFYADNVRIGNGTIQFDFHLLPGVLENYPSGLVMRDMEPGVPVPINIENATVALAIALYTGCIESELRSALKTFGGARRRFDFYIKKQDFVLLDDYAHHPDEIHAALSSLRALYADRKVTVVFQPHLYSRTKDLAPGFSAALDIAHRTLLLPIYPARELPIPGVTSSLILERMTSEKKEVVSKEQLIDRLVELRSAGDLDVVVMMGAGDIERLVAPVAEVFATL